LQLEKWFETLQARLEDISHRWPDASDEDRLAMANQLLEMRKWSDRLIDAWLVFEEKLSSVIKEVKGNHNQTTSVDGFLSDSEAITESAYPNGVAEDSDHKEPATVHSLFDSGTHDSDELQAVNSPADHPRYLTEALPLFRKGEGYYHLRLFGDARQHFEKLVLEFPDWEQGRLYYAYSLFFSHAREEATKQFRLLSKAAVSSQVISTACNALGCICAEEGQWLEAIQAFQEASRANPENREASFNLALCHLQMGEWDEAMEQAATYLKMEPEDWEAQAIWIRAAREMSRRDGLRAAHSLPSWLQGDQQERDVQTLREMALFFEENGWYHRARACYRLITEKHPVADWAWHGLAWNSWYINGSKEAVPLLKKAISLAPHTLDYLFSYGWILMFDGQEQSASRIFRQILSKERNHRLTQSAMIVLYQRLGDHHAAKQMARSFCKENDLYLSSLGYFHLGKLAMLEENWTLAVQYLKRVRYPLAELDSVMQICKEQIENRLAKPEAVLT
jgi:tetratricopeptide (TPR) repeat protein